MNRWWHRFAHGHWPMPVLTLGRSQWHYGCLLCQRDEPVRRSDRPW